jgi:hypothetical protein
MMAQSAKLGEFELLSMPSSSGWRRTLRGLSRCWTSNISLWRAASSYASLSRAALNLRALTSLRALAHLYMQALGRHLL